MSTLNDVEPIARALGQLKANALSGADTGGNFDQLDKATRLKIFMTSGSDTIRALKQLVAANETSEQQMTI